MEIDATMDQYEKQLYSLFKSYDSNQDGNLTHHALEDLCNVLQLENRGRQLISLLMKQSKNSSTVTFPEFRDGLLTVLGDENYDRSPVKLADRNDANSGEDSSGREISPKYVFGSKKYGRRSKPPSEDSSEFITDNPMETDNSSFEASSSDHVLNCDDKVLNCKKRRCTKLRRSISFSENRNVDSSGYISPSFGSSKNTKLSITKIESLDCTPETTTSQYDCSDNHHLPIPDTPDYKEDNITSLGLQTLSNSQMNNVQNEIKDELVGLDSIVELWDSAGIPNPQKLLYDLGFKQNHVNIAEIISTLEEEIKIAINNVQETLFSNSLVVFFQAILCLYQCNTKLLKLSLNHASAERDKLRTDLSDANQRAIILAHEVDENHSKMEHMNKNNMKQLEMKHSEIVKQLTEQFSAEKEMSLITINKLETRLNTMESEDIKLKAQISSIENDNFRLEKELNNSQEQIFELTEIKRQLSKEIKLLSSEKQKPRDVLLDEKDLTHLENQIIHLQQENTFLKDKNDELGAELENIQKNCISNKIISKLTWTEDPFQTNDSGVLSNEVLSNSIVLNGFHSNRSSPKKISSTFERGNSPDNIINSHNTEKISRKPGDSLDMKEINNQCPASILEISESHDKIQQYDLFLCVKHLTQTKLEDLEKKIQGNSNNFATIFAVSKMKPYYILLCHIVTKIMDDLQCLINDNSHLHKILLESDLISVLKILIEEITNVNQEIFKNLDDIYLKEFYTNIDSNFVNYFNDQNLNNSQYNNFEPEVVDLKKQILDIQNLLEKEQKDRMEEKQKDTEKYSELEANMELLKNEYDKCEEYWSSKVNEEREIFDQEQRITDEKFSELLHKLSEYEEQFASQDKPDRFDGTLATIEEKYSLEKQFTDLEEEFLEFKLNTENELKQKNLEIQRLSDELIKFKEANEVLESKKDNITDHKICLPDSNNSVQPIIKAFECVNENKTSPKYVDNSKSIIHNGNIEKCETIASPIDYLWNQSTISSPIVNMKNNIDSTRDYHNPAFAKDFLLPNNLGNLSDVNEVNNINPIQKPISHKNLSFFQQDVFTRNIDVNNSKKFIHCSELEETLQGRRKEVQQLEETKARLDAEVRALSVQKSNSPNQMGSAILKAVALEIHCRQLQTALRQQQSYAEAIMQQTIATHRSEIGALRQRLAAADLLVRDLYVENCYLARSLTTMVPK